MPDRCDKFTDRARKVLQLAHEEAQRLDHTYIWTEHLLLAVLSQLGGRASGMLERFGAPPGKVRTALEVLTGRSG